MHFLLLFCQQDACASHARVWELAVDYWGEFILSDDKEVSADVAS